MAEIRAAVNAVFVDEKIKTYILDLVFATRDPEAAGLKLAPLIAWGASPRATLALTQLARARALLRGRAFVVPEDVKAVGHDVLRHRILVTYEAEAREPDQRRHRHHRCSTASRCRRRDHGRTRASNVPIPRRDPRGRAPDRDPHAPPRRGGVLRRIPLGLQGPRHGVPRGARVRAGRRRARHRLERDRAHGTSPSSSCSTRSAN